MGIMNNVSVILEKESSVFGALGGGGGGGGEGGSSTRSSRQRVYGGDHYVHPHHLRHSIVY